MKPRIAVVISTHNRAHLIKNVLTSIRHQTIEDWEVIIMMDRCKDFTEFAIQTLADKRFKMYDSKGIGKSAALNEAKKYVTAPLVKFFDDDDMLVPCALEKYAQMMEETKADMGYSARYTLTLNNQMSFTENREFSMEDFLDRPMIGTGSLVVTKELYDKIDYDVEFPASMDFDFICKCGMTGAKVAYTDLPLYIYRNHLSSITFASNPIQYQYYEKAKCRTEEENRRKNVKNELVKWPLQVKSSEPHQKKK